MNRRAVTAMLVVFLALWGAGVPRFAHLMTAHVPGEGASAGSCSRCCSHCSLHRAPTELEPADAEKGHSDDDGSTEANHCPICELLGSLVTNVPALPAASFAWQPLVERVVDAQSRIALRVAFDPHAPRGPPAVA